MKTLLDTNVLSELMRPQPNAHVAHWVTDKAAHMLYISTITEAEILYGLGLLPQGKRRDVMTAAFQALLNRFFQKRVMAFDRREAACYAEIMIIRRSIGRPITQHDAMIAAIAKTHSMQLATRNTKDFEGLDIDIVNPFDE